MMWRRKIYYLVFLTCLALCGGCRLLESSVSDVQGWDISACVSGMDTCWDLFWDNSDKFEGGFADAMGGLSGGTK